MQSIASSLFQVFPNYCMKAVVEVQPKSHHVSINGCVGRVRIQVRVVLNWQRGGCVISAQPDDCRIIRRREYGYGYSLKSRMIFEALLFPSTMLPLFVMKARHTKREIRRQRKSPARSSSLRLCFPPSEAFVSWYLWALLMSSRVIRSIKGSQYSRCKTQMSPQSQPDRKGWCRTWSSHRW